MLLKFLQAHSEDPAPNQAEGNFWYGQEYSYLTRDMIDLTRRLVSYVKPTSGAGCGEEVDLVILPPLLDGKAKGRFLEYQHVGRRQSLGPWEPSGASLFSGLFLYYRTGKKKMSLLAAQLPEAERLKAASAQSSEWGKKSLGHFSALKLTVSADPLFAATARDLDLANKTGEGPFSSPRTAASSTIR